MCDPTSFDKNMHLALSSDSKCRGDPTGTNKISVGGVGELVGEEEHL